MNELEKEFVPYQIAVDMKSIGFNKPCLGYYYTLNGKDWKFAEKSEYNRLDDEINIGGKFSLLAPTFSQAFRWIDENTDLMGFVVPSIKDNHFDWLIRIDWEEEIECEEVYSSRIEAELECLRKLIELAKKLNK